jgi:ribosomal protein S18 acetylase RimI-like enzyme
MQRHGAGGAFAIEAGPLGLASGGGKPLPDAVRGKMEAALRADFSNVRVHTGPQAERIGAIAFTTGNDIYFASGRYQPHTLQGQQLLGHELAHVVQQRAGRVRNPLGTGLAVVLDKALEAEADRVGQLAAIARAAPSRNAQPSMRTDFRVVNLPGRVRIEALGTDRLAPTGAVELRHAPSGTAELCNLRVTEPYRRQQLGSALVRKAVEAARRVGALSVVLEARPADRGIDAKALVSMYQKLGFRTSGRSAAGNPVMQRATGRQIPSLPGSNPRRQIRTRSVQRMEVPTLVSPEVRQHTAMFSSYFGQIGEVEKIPRKDPNENDIMMYHMTSWKNLQSITKSGLDPKRGGRPGGSVGITEKKTLKAESVRTTLGKTAAATSNEVTAPYIHQRVAWAELIAGMPSANYEVLLRFSCKYGRKWTEDPVHHGAWHTVNVIGPDNIECLLPEGWTPILKVDAEALAAVANFPAERANAHKFKRGLAFTRDEFLEVLPHFKYLKSKEPREIWDELKKYRGSQVWLTTGTECTFAGTSAHPIREPEEWLYVCIAKGQVPPELAEAQKRYREKILLPGWDLEELT